MNLIAIIEIIESLKTYLSFFFSLLKNRNHNENQITLQIKLKKKRLPKKQQPPIIMRRAVPLVRLINASKTLDTNK